LSIDETKPAFLLYEMGRQLRPLSAEARESRSPVEGTDGGSVL
jgi:hypothetical protein